MPKSESPTYTPFSIRLTLEERARLEHDAAGQSMASYARARLFENSHQPKRKRGKFPVKDHEALGRVLALLGASEISASMRELSEAAYLGSLVVTPEVEAELLAACRTVSAYPPRSDEGPRRAGAARDPDRDVPKECCRMILKGSQRGGAKQLASHLLNADDNEHVELHDVRGFIGNTVHDALMESYAISRGTKCTQHLFSLSLSPPQDARVPVKDFENALSRIETEMGLEAQPRVIIFHEKDGRRHAHAVWSRIDAHEMKAVPLPHFKLKLREISRALYMEHDWTMPKGLMNSAERDPANFTLAEMAAGKARQAAPTGDQGDLP